MLPESVKGIIDKVMKQDEKDSEFHLLRRKGDQEEQVEDIYSGIQVLRNSKEIDTEKGFAYSLLPDGLSKTELLAFWDEFHNHFNFPDFSVFYSKRNFCVQFLGPDMNIIQSLPDGEDCFISLLADRKFLFLEDNEHGNNPEYPPMSEIIRNPERYLSSRTLSGKPSANQIADSEMRKNARKILKQGFMPTYAHKRAYNELKHNREDILAALRQREELIQRSAWFFQDGIAQFPMFTVPISQPEETSLPIDEELGQLFYDFLYAASHKAYVSKYDELLCHAQENSLSAISSVRKYLEEHPDVQICKALVFWKLFTQETTKLAKGELKDFKFKMSIVKTGRQLTRQTQAPTYRKIECQIMLFDYLLELLPPADENKEQAKAYARFQFHALSRYNGYTHYRINDIKHLTYDENNKCKYNFSLIPDSENSVDYLGGIVRQHILRCISNDVRWLTPGLPNNWNINSGILATLLLQDISQFPKNRRLTNRVYAFIKDKGKECVQTYLNIKDRQSELIDQLNKWCMENDLVFEDNIPSSNMEISDDKMKLLCSRMVLEYMLKERSLLEVRRRLSAVAQALWGHLLLTDYETFYLDEDT